MILLNLLNKYNHLEILILITKKAVIKNKSLYKYLKLVFRLYELYSNCVHTQYLTNLNRYVMIKKKIQVVM